MRSIAKICLKKHIKNEALQPGNALKKTDRKKRMNNTGATLNTETSREAFYLKDYIKEENPEENEDILDEDAYAEPEDVYDKDEAEIHEEELAQEIPTVSLEYYMSRIKKDDLLTAEQEIELGKRIRQGDKEAERELVEKNLRLVVSVARKYIGCGLDLDDMIQSGNIGLISAACRYDPELGYRFSTYATWWIKQAITREISNTGRNIRIPVHAIEKIHQIKKIKKEFEKENGREPDAGEIADSLGIKKQAVEHYMEISQEVVSLDKKIGDEEGSALIDFVEDDKYISAEEIIEKKMLAKEIEDIMKKTLSERERNVIRKRFGMEGDKLWTLEEIGKEMGVTRERVRQIQKNALRKLKIGIRKKRGISFSVKTQMESNRRTSRVPS